MFSVGTAKASLPAGAIGAEAMPNDLGGGTMAAVERCRRVHHQMMPREQSSCIFSYLGNVTLEASSNSLVKLSLCYLRRTIGEAQRLLALTQRTTSFLPPHGGCHEKRYAVCRSGFKIFITVTLGAFKPRRAMPVTEPLLM